MAGPADSKTGERGLSIEFLTAELKYPRFHECPAETAPLTGLKQPFHPLDESTESHCTRNQCRTTGRDPVLAPVFVSLSGKTPLSQTPYRNPDRDRYLAGCIQS